MSNLLVSCRLSAACCLRTATVLTTSWEARLPNCQVNSQVLPFPTSCMSAPLPTGITTYASLYVIACFFMNWLHDDTLVTWSPYYLWACTGLSAMYQSLAGIIKAASFPPCEQISGLFQYFIASNLKPVIVKLLSFCPSNIHLRQTVKMYAIIYEKYLMSILGHYKRISIFCLLSPIVKTELKR